MTPWQLVKHALVDAAQGSAKTYAMSSLFLSLLRRRIQWRDDSSLSFTTFVGVFRFITYLRRHRYRAPHALEDDESSKIAAALAAIAALHMLPPSKRSSVIAYAVVQAVMAGWSELKVDLKISPVALLSLASGPLLHMWIYHASSFEPAHLALLDRNSTLAPHVLANLRTKLRMDKTQALCQAIHPRHSSCASFQRDLIWRVFQRALVLFGPVHLLTHLRSKASVLTRAQYLLRSCVFLTSYYVLPIIVSCHLSQWLSPHRLSNAKRIQLGGAISAVAVMLEPHARQQSICAMVWTYVLIAGARKQRQVWSRLGLLRSHSSSKRTIVDMTVFALSMVMILKQRTQQNRYLIQLIYGPDVHTKSDKNDIKKTAPTTTTLR